MTLFSFPVFTNDIKISSTVRFAWTCASRLLYSIIIHNIQIILLVIMIDTMFFFKNVLNKKITTSIQNLCHDQKILVLRFLKKLRRSSGPVKMVFEHLKAPACNFGGNGFLGSSWNNIRTRFEVSVSTLFQKLDFFKRWFTEHEKHQCFGVDQLWFHLNQGSPELKN